MLSQFEDMVSKSEITITKESDLSGDVLEEYESTLKLLATEMNVDLSRKRAHNGGEVRSMAMAFSMGMSYFISDDHGARVAAKRHLVLLDKSWLETIRMSDIMAHIRDNSEELEITRKTARNIYLCSVNPKTARSEDEKTKLEKMRAKMLIKFNEEIWPLTK